MRQGRVEVQEAMVKAFQQGSEGWNQRTQETEQKDTKSVESSAQSASNIKAVLLASQLPGE